MPNIESNLKNKSNQQSDQDRFQWCSGSQEGSSFFLEVTGTILLYFLFTGVILSEEEGEDKECFPLIGPWHLFKTP